MSTGKKVLYISYDGLTDPLGQSHVLAYMEKLTSTYIVHIISCEKKTRFTEYGKEIEASCKDAGILWFPVVYTKSPPVVSTMYDVWKIKNKIQKLYREHKYDI